MMQFKTELTPVDAPPREWRAGLIVQPLDHGNLSTTWECLLPLLARGFDHARVTGTCVDKARSQLASVALKRHPEQSHWLWVDSDMAFMPEAVDLMYETALRTDADVVSAVCVRKVVGGHFIPQLHDTTKTHMRLGQGGDVIQGKRTGLAFAITKASFFRELSEKLPICAFRDEDHGWPFFLPVLEERPAPLPPLYLGEDFSFFATAERLLDRPVSLYLDGRARCWHIGDYWYGWEDMGDGECPLPRARPTPPTPTPKLPPPAWAKHARDLAIIIEDLHDEMHKEGYPDLRDHASAILEGMRKDAAAEGASKEEPTP